MVFCCQFWFPKQLSEIIVIDIVLKVQEKKVDVRGNVKAIIIFCWNKDLDLPMVVKLQMSKGAMIAQESTRT